MDLSSPPPYSSSTRTSKTDQRMLAKLPPGPIMDRAPVLAVFEGITDHTAHHRGSLAVYARLLGKEPKMPYAD